MEQEIMTNNLDETQRLATSLATTMKQTVFLLYGDLGSGKTTFTQGFAKALGIERRIQSPTFIIMRTYVLNRKAQSAIHSAGSGQERKALYHVDLYRINNEQEIIDLGLLEVMRDPKNIVIIEWPEKLGSLKPENAISIQFEYIDEERRKITIKGNKSDI